MRASLALTLPGEYAEHMRFTILFAFLLASCASSAAVDSEAQTGGESSDQSSLVECVRTGCGGQICTEFGNEIMTTCEFRPEHACYREAVCERQPNGERGFTDTPELRACLASPPSVE